MSISVSANQRDLFYETLTHLMLRLGLRNRSALIVELVIASHTGDSNRILEAASTPREPITPQEVAVDKRPVFVISITPDRKEAFDHALAYLHQQTPFESTSSLIVNLVIKAGAHLDVPPAAISHGDDSNAEEHLRTFPELYREKFYAGQLDSLVSAVPDVQKTLASLADDAAYPADVLSLNYQLVGIVLCDTGSFDDAFAMMERAVAFAQKLPDTHPERANLIATAYYRQGTLFLQLMEGAPTPHKVALLNQAKQSTAYALELVSMCDPIVQAVIWIRHVLILAQTGASEQDILAHLATIEALAARGVEGYHPVGLLFRQPSVDHTYAQVAYYLVVAGRSPEEKKLSPEEALKRLEASHGDTLPAPQRWAVDQAITRVKLLIVCDRLHSAVEEAKQIYPYLTRVQSQRLRQSLDQALHTIPPVESERDALRKKIAALR